VLVDHDEQRPKLSGRPHDGAVRGTRRNGGCVRSELTDGLPRSSLSAVAGGIAVILFSRAKHAGSIHGIVLNSERQIHDRRN